MSSKTSFKRIALVAASALAIAGFSAVPANANLTGGTNVVTYTATAGVTGIAGTTAAVTGNGIVGTPITLTITNTITGATDGDTVTDLPVLSGTATGTTVAGATHAVVSNTAGGSTTVVTAGSAAIAVIGGTANTSVRTLIFTPTTVGTYIFTSALLTSNITTAGAITITVPATAGTPTLPIYLDATGSTVAAATFVAAKAAGDATYTAGLITGSMTAITTTAGAAVVLGVKAAASAFGINDIFDLSLNGTIVATAVGDYTQVSNNLTYTPAAAGTYTGNIRVYVTGTTRVAATGTFDLPFTWTVTAATDLSIALSSAFMTTPSAGGAAASTTTNAVARSAPKAVNTGIAQIKVTLLKADAAADTQAHVVTAYLTGVGYVSSEAAATVDTPGTPATRVDTDNSAASVRYVHINSDGTAGTGTVTVTVQNINTLVTTTLGTWSYTSTGTVASFALSSSNFTIGAAGGDTTGKADTTRNLEGEVTNAGALNNSTTTPAFIAIAKDAAGNAANFAVLPTITSSNALVVSGGTCVLDGGADATYSSGGAGYYNCAFTTSTSAKSGETATLTVKGIDPAGDGTTYLSFTYAVTVGGSVATEVLAFNKDAYATGESTIISLTAKDASGNPVADGSASPLVTFNKSVGGTYAESTYVGGTRANTANTLFAPGTVGEFTAFATSGNAASTALSATSAVEGDGTSSLALDAANAATDAANNAYDEAQNATQAASDALAATTALAKQVKKLIKQVDKAAKAIAAYKARTGR